MSEQKDINRREFLKRLGIGAAAQQQLWRAAIQRVIRWLPAGWHKAKFRPTR